MIIVLLLILILHYLRQVALEKFHQFPKSLLILQKIPIMMIYLLSFQVILTHTLRLNLAKLGNVVYHSSMNKVYRLPGVANREVWFHHKDYSSRYSESSPSLFPRFPKFILLSRCTKCAQYLSRQPNQKILFF